MRAIQLGEGDGLSRLAETTLPDPGSPASGEIRVRLHATSLNYHDYRVAVGGIPTAPGRIPMADGAGVVEAVGDGISEFQVGDHVVSTFFPDWLEGAPQAIGFGSVPGDGVDGYAREVVVAPATCFTLAPRGYSHTEAATVTTAAVTAWRALVVDARIKPDDVVVVLGTGGVSIFALQFAWAVGARVVVTSSSEAKLERALELGASHGINYRKVPDWGRAVTDWTDGRGADCILDVGGAGTLGESMSAARIGGFISVVGTLTGFTAPFDTRWMLLKQLRMQGLVVGSRQHQQQCVEALQEHAVKPEIDRSFALEDLESAFRYQESGEHFGKICAEW